MKNYLLPDKYYQTWVLFLQVRRLLINARHREYKKYGITPQQYSVLISIKTLGGKTSPSELAQLVLKAPHTISAILTRMENAGLILKRNSKSKKGMKEISLTKKGENAVLLCNRSELIKKSFSCLSDEEHEQLILINTKLRENILKVTATNDIPVIANGE
jgi:DNA-binding MarR family transcriptional regulator